MSTSLEGGLGPGRPPLAPAEAAARLEAYAAACRAALPAGVAAPLLRAAPAGLGVLFLPDQLAALVLRPLARPSPCPEG